MLKGYKFRIYPTHEQKVLIHKSFGCSRFVYNYYLAKIKDSNYKNAFSCIKDYVNHLKYEYSFLQEVDSIIIRKSLFNLEDAFQRYFFTDKPKVDILFSHDDFDSSMKEILHIKDYLELHIIYLKIKFHIIYIGHIHNSYKKI